ASPDLSESTVGLHFVDSDDEPDVHEADYSHYSQQMDDLMDGEDPEGNAKGAENEGSDDDEGFVYTGVDAPDISSLSYQDQLRDVLDQDNTESSANDANEVEISLMVDDNSEPLVCNIYLSSSI
ncbi:hypothetical protein FA15DRAFT_575908, partial [Coprinopsis marcescibilis]